MASGAQTGLTDPALENIKPSLQEQSLLPSQHENLALSSNNASVAAAATAAARLAQITRQQNTQAQTNGASAFQQSFQNQVDRALQVASANANALKGIPTLNEEAQNDGENTLNENGDAIDNEPQEEGKRHRQLGGRLRCEECISARRKCVVREDVEGCDLCVEMGAMCCFTRTIQVKARRKEFSWDVLVTENGFLPKMNMIVGEGISVPAPSTNGNGTSQNGHRRKSLPNNSRGYARGRQGMSQNQQGQSIPSQNHTLLGNGANGTVDGEEGGHFDLDDSEQQYPMPDPGGYNPNGIDMVTPYRSHGKNDSIEQNVAHRLADATDLMNTPEEYQPPTRNSYPCSECDSTFTRSSDLRRHIRAKHEQASQMFECPHKTCDRHGDRGFTRLDHLRAHIKRIHREQPLPPLPDGISEHQASLLGYETPQPGKRKRELTLEGRTEAREMRAIGACDDCRKHKRKCNPDHLLARPPSLLPDGEMDMDGTDTPQHDPSNPHSHQGTPSESQSHAHHAQMQHSQHLHPDLASVGILPYTPPPRNGTHSQHQQQHQATLASMGLPGHNLASMSNLMGPNWMQDIENLGVNVGDLGVYKTDEDGGDEQDVVGVDSVGVDV